MPRSTWKVSGFLFVSGMCSLVYEMAWIRELRLIFGSSMGASAAVLACFMGGLGLGGLLLGRRADRGERTLRSYAALEAIIALGALATPVLLAMARAAYIALGGSGALGTAGATAARLILSALIFAVPAVAMGGTLPAAARALGKSDDPDRRRVALLYGMNALGGAVGCLLATFLLFEVMGTRKTLWGFCLINLGVAALAWRLPSAGAETERAGDVATEGGPLPGVRSTPRALVLVAAAVTGFVFCLMELVWYRMLSPLLGGSVFTFGLILAVMLAGIGLGGAVYAAARLGSAPTLRRFGWVGLLGALAVAGPRAYGDRLAVLSAILRPVGALGFAMQVAEWAFVTCLVVLPVAMIAGVQFPMLIALLGRGDERAARDIGQAYAYNTAGAIGGSLAGGFGLIPGIGASECWRLGGALLALLGGAALLIDARRRRSTASLAPALLAAALAIATLSAEGPTAAWRHSPIGAALVDPDLLRTPNAIRAWLSERRRAIDWQTDGRESSIGIDALNGVSFVVNGKNDGNARGDAATTVMLGLLGAFLHPDTRRSMVIGLGTGASAGWLAAVPTMKTVDVAELEPSVVEVARRSAPINAEVLDNPKVHIVFGDARETLLTSKAKYDLIASEPSNPYRAGVASLFTREFYQAARASLEDDGLFLQWVQAYGVEGRTMRTVYATIASVFPAVESWHLKSDDLLLVASRHPIALDAPTLRARLGEEPFRSAFAFAWRTTALEGILAHYVAGAGTAAAIAAEEGDEINTDDRNVVEFGFASSSSANADFSVNDVRALARSRGDNVPRVQGGPLDWNAVEEEVVALLADEGLIVARQGPEETPGLARRIAALNAYQRSDYAGVVREWSSQAQEPYGPTEGAILATALADAGDPAAARYIAAMRTFDEVEADVTQARLSFRRGRIEETMRALETAYAGYRGDPWPLPALVLRSLTLSTELLARYPALAERLSLALREPFSMRLAEEVRRKVLALAAMGMAPGAPCIEANARFEPNPVWSEEFLTARAECYAATRHPLAVRAKEDLRELIRLSPDGFSRDANAPSLAPRQ